jgi:MSHA type pilus biogenesis protein MshL
MQILPFFTLVIAACGTSPPSATQHGHIRITHPAGEIPEIVDSFADMDRPSPAIDTGYSVTVSDVPVRDLLFALARDADLDIDIAPEIHGKVTLKASQKSLPSLLERIARQVPLRFEFTPDSLLILPDTPYFGYYPVDYVNLGRTVNSSIANNMQIGSAGENPGGGSLSNTRIENASTHRFWESLEKNLGLLLKTTAPSADKDQPPRLIIDAEAGLVAAYATQREHRQIRQFIGRVLKAARRQVMIEATIVEVALSDGYQQGIDWSGLVRGGIFTYVGNPLRGSVNLTYNRNDNPQALVSLLERFGTSRVLSSPRLSVLNNQMALLKVVENYVYFQVRADTTTTANVGTTITYTTTPQTVSVGLVMGVTPQIATDDSVLLNIRPSITSIDREIPDPNPDLRRYGIENLVPMIRTREIESVMRIANGQTAVLGGLMEDRADYQTQRLPVLGEIPLAGEVLNNRNNRTRKTELVIFLRPLVIREPSLRGDYAALADLLPRPDFFAIPRHARPFKHFSDTEH